MTPKDVLRFFTKPSNLVRQEKEEKRMADTDAHIAVKDLTLAYGRYVVQQHLTFTIKHGEVFIIMGGSGCHQKDFDKQITEVRCQKTDDRIRPALASGS
jgi:phospholipid/cholesterol/gamma-HCH transport system ATP-binding protein